MKVCASIHAVYRSVLDITAGEGLNMFFSLDDIPTVEWIDKTIGVLFGCFGGQIDGPGLPGGFIIYQGNPSISPNRTPMDKISHQLAWMT